MKLFRRLLLAILLILIVVCTLCESKRRRIPSRMKLKSNLKAKNQKQLLYETRETSPPNFVTLLIFRLIYGIASQMGVEERLPGFMLPPNADDDGGFFSLGSSATSFLGGGGDDDDYDLGF